MSKPPCPCMECQRRELGCHGRCESYMEWKQKHQERKDAITAERDKDREYMSFHEDAKRRARKR